MFATSAAYHDRPEASPRPFDRARDGLVIGEGAGTLVLEARDHAIARGAPILAEVLGYGTNCDGLHVTAPSQEGTREAMALGLRDAGLEPGDIDYINAHGTATELGACGAIEAVYCLGMMAQGFIAPTRTLEDVDPRCGALDYVKSPRDARLNTVMSNNFAFGGVNTSLVFGRVD